MFWLKSLCVRTRSRRSAGSIGRIFCCRVLLIMLLMDANHATSRDSVQKEIANAMAYINAGAKYPRSSHATSHLCHALRRPPGQPSHALSAADKLALSPLVVVGRVISRSNSYNGLYFASFRLIRVLKGKVPKKIRR